MAQFYENFNGATVGVAHPDFTLEFGDAAQAVQAGNVLAESDASMRIDYVSGTFLRSAFSWGVGTTSGATTVRFLATFDNHTAANSGQIVGPILSGSGDDATYTGYAVWYGESYRLSRYDAGSDAAVDTASGPLTAGARTWYIELYRNGSQIEGRAWDYNGGARPATADVSYTDTSPLAVAGFFGVSALLTNTADITQPFVVHEIAAATDGDALPTGPTLPTTRKGSQFTVDKPGTLGTVTTATLNAVNVFDHLTAQDATTATFAGALTDEITTSGTYSLVLGDGTTTETISVQVNVYGIVPSDNPWQKEGVALASLTNVQYRLVAGSALNGTQLHYTGAGTTDASGNIPTFDVSDTAAVVDDVVHIVGLTATGESIVAPETVELI